MSRHLSALSVLSGRCAGSPGMPCRCPGGAETGSARNTDTQHSILYHNTIHFTANPSIVYAWALPHKLHVILNTHGTCLKNQNYSVMHSTLILLT